MKHLWIFLVIGIVGSHGVAAADGAIRVAVTDGERHTPLAGANVSVPGISRAGSTDAGGICELAGIPAGRITLRIAFVGYSTSTVSLEVREGETVSVAVALKPVVIPGQPITVTASRGREREHRRRFPRSGGRRSVSATPHRTSPFSWRNFPPRRTTRRVVPGSATPI